MTIPGTSSVVKGTFHGVSAAEIATWDLTTSGQDANAPAGTHVCDSADTIYGAWANHEFDTGVKSILLY